MRQPIRIGAAALAAGLFLAPVGCGKADGPGTQEKKGDTPAAPTPVAPGQPGVTPMSPTPPGPSLLAPTDPVQQAAEKFVADLGKAADTPGPFPPDVMDRIAPSFLKAIGKPALTDADKKRGYSLDAAEAWLRRAGTTLAGLGLPTGYGSPTAAVFVGSFGNGGGRYLLRLVQAAGSWKADWFSLGTAKTTSIVPTSADEPYQDFAILSFLDALTTTAMSKEDRVLLIGAVTSPRLKQTLAEPFAQDKDRGYDFNATRLGERTVDAYGTGVAAYSRTSTGSNQFTVQLTASGMAKTCSLILVKGTAPDEWLVDEFTKP